MAPNTPVSSLRSTLRLNKWAQDFQEKGATFNSPTQDNPHGDLRCNGYKTQPVTLLNIVNRVEGTPNVYVASIGHETRHIRLTAHQINVAHDQEIVFTAKKDEKIPNFYVDTQRGRKPPAFIQARSLHKQIGEGRVVIPNNDAPLAPNTRLLLVGDIQDISCAEPRLKKSESTKGTDKKKRPADQSKTEITSKRTPRKLPPGFVDYASLFDSGVSHRVAQDQSSGSVLDIDQLSEAGNPSSDPDLSELGVKESSSGPLEIDVAGRVEDRLEDRLGLGEPEEGLLDIEYPTNEPVHLDPWSPQDVLNDDGVDPLIHLDQKDSDHETQDQKEGASQPVSGSDIAETPGAAITLVPNPLGDRVRLPLSTGNESLPTAAALSHSTAAVPNPLETTHQDTRSADESASGKPKAKSS